MNTRLFLEQAIDELEETREENKELKRQVALYEKFVQYIEELLCEGDNEHCEKTNILNT